MGRPRRAALAGIHEGGEALEVDLPQVPRQNSGCNSHALEYDSTQRRIGFLAQVVSTTRFLVGDETVAHYLRPQRDPTWSPELDVGLLAIRQFIGNFTLHAVLGAFLLQQSRCRLLSTRNEWPFHGFL
jgi:hypothetical protein